MTTERLQQLLARLDELNSADPHQILVEGQPVPHELAYAQRLGAWVARLAPNASEPLRIAARGQHVCRWMIPRDQYERNRRGYLRWRETLKTFHAQKVEEEMRALGYDEATIQRVRSLILKKQLGTDPEVQVLEDALCLVFLETQFADLRQKTPDEKMREVVQKTWKKMSPQAHQIASQLPLSDEDKAWLQQVIV